MKTTGPVLIHVVTEKGRGYPYAKKAADKYHSKVLLYWLKNVIRTLVTHMLVSGVTKFDPATGKQFKSSAPTQSYTSYFAETLIAEAEADKDVVAIHAAMGVGTGLNLFLRHFPTRCFDVGIAEQHAVTFAAGLACEGLKPFCAICLSFMQRAYDQVVHDVDLQKLPVSLAKSHEILITVEEGSIGGFGSHVAQFMALDGILDGNFKWRPLVLPDRYIDHGSPADQPVEAGHTPSHIGATVFNVLGKTREALEIMSEV
ncbi:unnamed protein product [Fraxinus pennsylvanica]|uniref:1-deoxy-D-xylulose-5-phosphate synthase n=1 Tax=Fraxinus pennsylvanica TaxID=56036 RepID=A0AAD2AAA1_9LAMI|nr:unnamed protein product [Fraxinus pennsylvanica]